MKNKHMSKQKAGVYTDVYIYKCVYMYIFLGLWPPSQHTAIRTSHLPPIL